MGTDIRVRWAEGGVGAGEADQGDVRDDGAGVQGCRAAGEIRQVT